jgi:hypothetical protein
MDRPSHTLHAPPPVAAVLGWIVPGAGYMAIGERARGITVGVTILSLFVMGMLIGGIKVVDPPKFDGETTVMAALLDKPWYIGQIFAGPIAIVSGWIGRSDWAVGSHARVQEIGTLYTAVAGMLNLLAIIDACYRAAGYGEGEAPGGEGGAA